MPKKQPVRKQTSSITNEQLTNLRALLPHVFSEGKIDFEKLRAALGDFGDERPERYSFTWAGKREAIRILQTPSRATLVPARKESVDFDKTQNIFIEGDNLEVLKLLYKPYFGQVKMIYIDPPYNTGNDFVYPDNFADPLDTYLKLTNQKDSNGNLLTSNAETSGRYHSAWLSMMYPRLFLARQLLRDDGLIFISIDDHEVHNLRLVMNEIFGEENFITQITIQSNPRGRQSERFVATVHEYVLGYARNSELCSVAGMALTEEQIRDFKYKDETGRSYRLLGLRQRGSASRREERPDMFFPIYINPSNGKISLTKDRQFSTEVLPKKSTGEDGRWSWGRAKAQRDIALLEAKHINTRNEWDIFVRDYLATDDGQERTRKSKTIWDEKELNYQNGTVELKELLASSVVEYPKPVALLQKILIMAGDSEGVYLDFFAGSSTTAQAVLELNREDGGNRKFILVQLPEPTGNKEFPTIAEIGKERIRRVIKKMKKEREGQFKLDKPEDLGFKVFKLRESNYKQWVFDSIDDPKAYIKQLEMFADPLIEDWLDENVTYEVSLKEGYGLNVDIDPKGFKNPSGLYRVTDADKDQSFYICLADKIKLKDLKPLNLKKDDLFICRDVALDDETAANLSLQCRLKTI